MGNVDVWLKRSYIIAAGLIGAFGTLLLGFTLFSHGYFHEDEEIEKALPLLHFMYAISIIILLVTAVGLFGACKEKKWALILFAVVMILGSLFLLAVIINTVSVQPQLAKQMKKHYVDMVRISNHSQVVLDSLNTAQNDFQCCGLSDGYLDWGYNIPESCLCAEGSTKPCVAAPRNSSLFEHHAGDEPIMIYKDPCMTYIIDHALGVIKTVIGVIMGIVLLWVLAVVLSIVILCRLSKKVETPTVVYSQKVKAGNYSILTESEDLT